MGAFLAPGRAQFDDRAGLERDVEVRGGWFFLAASEAISVGNKTYTLPGIGSYVAAAVDKGDIGEVGIAIAVMVILVVGVNFVFWRPLVAYAEKFRVETSEAAEQPKSYVLNLLRVSSIPSYIAKPLKPAGRALDRVTRPFGLAEYPRSIRSTGAGLVMSYSRP